MTTGQNSLRPLHSKLEPLLSLGLPKGWTRVLLNDGREIFGVGFSYRDERRDSVDISYWDHISSFQTWVCGHTDNEYETLDEAIERAKQLMTIVARGVHWSEIASVRNEEYGMSLIDRDGIGKVTITMLLDRVSNLKSLLEASIEDIESIQGIGEDKAWLISDHLHPNVRYHELWDPNEERWVNLYQVPAEVIAQCVLTNTYLTQSVRKRYRIPAGEIRDRGLVKEMK